MLTRKLVIPAVLAVMVGCGTTAVSIAATMHGGMLGSAVPESIIPANADLFAGLDRGDTQGTSLVQLWNTYRNHPGTAQALARLGADVNSQGQAMQELTKLLAPFGDRAGLALWAPLTSKGQPSIALVAQLKMTNLLGGQMPLNGLATLTPSTSYRGIQIYSVSMKNAGGAAYACVVSGDGVLATDTKTIMRVIDTATFNAPSLANDASFASTISTLPSPRLLTLYIGPHLLTAAESLSGLPRRSSTFGPTTLTSSLLHPVALAITASPDGLGLTTSAVTAPAGSLHPNPNAGAGVTVQNAVLYSSVSDIAAMLMAAHVLTPKDLAQFQQQSGIDLQRDVLSWMNGEFAMNLNSSTSPIVDVLAASLTRSAGSGGAVVPPALPGSLELAWHVDDPAAVQQSLNRIVAALQNDLSKANTGSSTLPPTLNFTVTTLPNGTQAHVLAVLPGLGYAFQGHWLLLSTNVMNDANNPPALTTNADYIAALAHVAGPGALLNVSYLDVTRLLSAVDKWVAYVSKHTPASPGAAPLSRHGRIHIAPLQMQISAATTEASRRLARQTRPLLHGLLSSAASLDNSVQRSVLKASSPNLTWQQIEPLIAPLHTLTNVTRQVGASGEQLQAFLAIK